MRYCIGDIHGCFKTLKDLLRQIFIETKQPDIYIVGDMIDRGPSSKEVIDLILDLKNKGINIECIRGNHEEMLLDSYKKNLKIGDSEWQYNGAEATIRSFNSLANINLKVNDLIPVKYHDFLKSLPYFIELKDYIIVHAGLNFKSKNPFIEIESMLWTREEQYNSVLSKGKIVVHGHTPIPFNEIKSRIELKKSSVLNIDSGCVYIQRHGLGSLTAINLDTRGLINVKNIDLN